MSDLREQLARHFFELLSPWPYAWEHEDTQEYMGVLADEMIRQMEWARFCGSDAGQVIAMMDDGRSASEVITGPLTLAPPEWKP